MFIVVYAYDTARSLFLIVAAQIQATLNTPFDSRDTDWQITSGDDDTSVAGTEIISVEYFTVLRKI